MIIILICTEFNYLVLSPVDMTPEVLLHNESEIERPPLERFERHLAFLGTGPCLGGKVVA